jgi:NOL1/NOP2/fmu family ribosome biogenesis protein
MIQEVSLLPRWSGSKSTFEPEDHSRIVEMWQDRFGTPKKIFDGYSFYRRAKNIWVFSDAPLPMLSYEAVGLRIMNFKETPWKPTTCALQVFGKFATRNSVYLNAKQARLFLSGNGQWVETNADPGYVVVFYMGEVLGCGLYSHGKLASQLPMERRIDGDMEMDV